MKQTSSENGNVSEQSFWSPPEPMTNSEFKALGDFIQTEFGIKMPLSKKTMLQSRLTKRLRALNMSCYRQYQEYLFSAEGLVRELPLLIDAVTTNKTDFFREPSHFDLLADSLLPLWMQKSRGHQRFSVWSAGCATGEEPYSLAMVLGEFARREPAFDFEVLGTDISGKALETARQAIYPARRIEPVPTTIRKRYLMRSRDRAKELVRIVPELRSKTTFRPLNLMEPFSCPGTKKDAIFCRNVIIYFERPVQEAIFSRFCACLKPGGHLFIGHSETLNGMRLPLRTVRPTVYQKV
ncbi:MAG: CheR family methyltransferase [Desulfosudaceae bacterium]